MKPCDEDIVFGDCKFLDEHPGTKKWASIIGVYSRQTYWSESVYKNIRNDKRMKPKKYMILTRGNKFRLATEEEIEERTCAVFQNGGGKKRSSKRRKLRHHASSSNDSGEVGPSSDFKTGDDVYAFDQLWRASIIEKSDFLDGTKYLLSYKGFRGDANNWVDGLQLLPSNGETSDLYHHLDKAETTAFENEDNDILGIGVAKTDSPPKPIKSTSMPYRSKGKTSARKPESIPPSPTCTVPLPRNEISHQLVVPSTMDLDNVVKQALAKCTDAVNRSNDAGIGFTVETIVAGEAAKWTESTLSAIFIPTVLGALPKTKELKDKANNLKNEGGGLKRLASLAMERNEQKWAKAQKHLASFVQCLVDDL